MATTVITKLLGGGPNSSFVNRYSVRRSDGTLFTDTTNGLTAGALVLSVANGNALTGFEPPIGNDPTPPYAARPGTGPGWTPDATQVNVYGYTASLNDAGGALTPIVGSVRLDASTFLRDTGDTSGTSVKCTLYMTSACFQTIIIEVPV